MFYRLKSLVAFFKIIIYNKLYLTCIWLVLIYDLLEERRVDDITIKKFFLIPYSISQKTNRFHVAVRLSSNWSKKTLKCDMVLWSAITSSLMPGCWKQESDAGDVTTQTFVNQEFARASITREKKTRHVLCRNLLSQHIHLLCKREYFLKNIMGNVDASKISKIFNLFLFHSLAWPTGHTLILSNLSYWLVQHRYHTSRHVDL